MSCRRILQQYSKLTPSIVWLRHSSSAPTLKTERKDINKNVKIYQQVSGRGESRPMVLLFGWLLAKPKHLKKFTDFYLEQGFDVLSIQIFLGQLLRPKRVQAVMSNVLDLCYEGQREYQPIICHGFSVGGYLYGEVLNCLLEQGDKYKNFGDRVYGQIFDSPVDFYGVPNGVARAITKNRTKAAKIESALEWYMHKFENITKDYIRSSQTFQANILRTRSLFLYSLSDPVCDARHIEQIARNWRTAGIEAETVFWKHAPHVTSFRNYPQEYKYYVKDFLWRTGIPGHKMSKDDLDLVNEDADRLAQRTVNASLAFA